MKNFFHGQSLIELLVAIGLAAIILPALLTGFVSSREGKAQQFQRLEATALLRESEEAVRSIREKGWTFITTNGTYHPSTNGSTWSLSPSPEPIADYTRQVVISDAQRDSNGNIVSSGGTVDSSTKKVVTTVSWNTPQSSSITSTNYFQRYLGNNAFNHTTQADFNGGAKNNTQVVSTGDGAVVLTQSGGGTNDWGNKFRVGTPDGTTATSSIGNMTSANHKTSLRFTAQASKTVNAIRVYLHSEAGTSPTYRFGVQTDVSGLPSGTYLGSGTLVATSTGWKTITLSPSVNITAGTTYHVVIQYQSGTISTSRYIALRQSSPLNQLYPYNNNPDINANTLFNSGSSWTVQNYQPPYELDFSDSTYEGNPYESSTAVSIYGANYIGEKFRFTDTAKTATEISFYVSQSTATEPADSLRVVLQNADTGQTMIDQVLATAAEVTQTYAYIKKAFSTSQTLQPNTNYRIYLKSPSSNSTNYYRVYRDVATNSANYNSITYGGTASVYTVSSNSGSSWTDTNTNWDIGGYYFTVQNPASYAASGDFTSHSTGSFDGGNIVAFNRIAWNASVPVNTTLRFQIATSDTNPSPSTFVGPDGTVDSYYTASSTITPFNQINGRYIRYKAFFTSDGSATPTLNDVAINYSP